jgi:hypothetical protein
VNTGLQPRDLLEKSIFEALRNYSNVHRGSGHKSISSMLLFEHSGKIVLDYLGSSEDRGLSLGIRAIAVKKTALPGGPPPQSGGGNAKPISREWVIWTKAPGKSESGTPAVINIIALARALRLEMIYGRQVSQGPDGRGTSSGGLLTSRFMDGYRGKELLDALRDARIRLDLHVPTVQGERPFINFDRSASTHTFLPVWNIFRHFMYSAGTDRNELTETVQKICLEFPGASGKDVNRILADYSMVCRNRVFSTL